VEFYLFDPLHKKPLYGSRGRLIAALLEQWVKEQQEASRAAQANLTPQGHDNARN
jgi:hypothetical protein